MEMCWTRASDMAGAPLVIGGSVLGGGAENGGWSRHSGHRRPRFCSLRMDPSGRQGPLSSGRPPAAVPLKISMTTPRSRSVPRYAAAELTAENHAVPPVGLRNGLVEVRSGDGDMVDALALLGEKTRVDALLVERLDPLPLHLADRGDCKAPGALDRLTVLAEILRFAGVELV